MDFTKIVTASECGLDGLYASQNIFNLIQDHVTVTFGAFGSDNVTLRYQYHCMWIFSKNKVKVYRRPHWNEELKVHCNIVKANRLICYVRTLAEDKEGKTVIDGIVECCVIDIETFKFVKLTDIPFEMHSEECDTSFDFNETDGELISSFAVDHTLCDMSRHMNNAKALIPFYSALPYEKVQEIESRPYEIAIKYTKQALHGTNLKLYVSDRNGIDFVYKNDDGETVEVGYLRNIQ